MNPLFVAAAEVQDLCRDRDWGFCFIGGLAVLRRRVRRYDRVATRQTHASGLRIRCQRS